MGSSGRSCLIVGNHTSFMDTLVAVVANPLRNVGSVRMMVGNHLFRMPFLGTIVKAMGHESVPFKQDEATQKWTLDKEEMAARMKDLEAHVDRGGHLAWFPEGALNLGDPHKVGMFRAGGFVIPVHIDVEIWIMAAVGNSVCWPPSSTVGGRPATMALKMFRLCESSHDFLSKLPDDEKERSVFLANTAHDRVQKFVDEFVAEGFDGNIHSDEEKEEDYKELLEERAN